MNNSYLAAILIVVVAIIAFVFASKKSEAPTNEDSMQSTTTVMASFVDGDYSLETGSSSVSWEGEYLTGLKEHGTVKLLSGSYKVVNGMITEGEFVLDMNSIKDDANKEMLENHLKSDDFFSVSTYPTAKFVLKKMQPASPESVKFGKYVIAGDLTVRNITLPISIIVTILGNDKSMEASGSFAINRADWEIKYNSPTFFGNLGEKIIRDAITIGLDLKAQRVIQ